MYNSLKNLMSKQESVSTIKKWLLVTRLLMLCIIIILPNLFPSKDSNQCLNELYIIIW
jgi:hypothetical protein